MHNCVEVVHNNTAKKPNHNPNPDPILNPIPNPKYIRLRYISCMFYYAYAISHHSISDPRICILAKVSYLVGLVRNFNRVRVRVSVRKLKVV